MDLYFITSNESKIASATKFLKEYGITVIPHSIPSIIEPREYDPREVTRQKISQVRYQFDEPFIVSDTGFFVHSLKGFPKTFTNFMLETIGIEGLLRLLDGKERSCEFIQCLGYLGKLQLPNEERYLPEPNIFEWKVSGSVAGETRGTLQSYHWSNLALVFKPNGSNKTLAEMSEEEFHDWRESVRPNEFDKLGEHLSKRSRL